MTHTPDLTIAHFFDVSNPTLLSTIYSAGNPTGLSLFNDLTSGIQYGTFSYEYPPFPNRLQSVLLSAEAIVEINTTMDGLFAVGFFHHDVAGTNFASVTSDPTNILRLEITSVPIPAAAWLFGSGLLGLVGMARRKKAG
jgi:hypothetical protein